MSSSPTIQVAGSPMHRCPAPILSQSKEQFKAQGLTCCWDLALSDPWFPPVPQLETPSLSLSASPLLHALWWIYHRPLVTGSTALSCENLFSKRPHPPLIPLFPAYCFIDFPVLTVCLLTWRCFLETTSPEV